MSHPAPSSMTVALLKEELSKLGLPTTGLKAELVARVTAARAEEAVADEPAAAQDASTGVAEAAASNTSSKQETNQTGSIEVSAPVTVTTTIHPEELAGQVASAVGVVEQYRMGSPLAPLQNAVAVLVSALAEGCGAPEPIVKLAATTLLTAPTHCHGQWEAAVIPVISSVLTNPTVSWIQRAFVAKKIPSSLQGQNAWGGADVVKSRTRAVVCGLMQQAAIGGGASPQELRVVSDALFSVLSTSTAAAAEIAKALATASGSSLSSLLPLLLSRNPPASFICLIEDALCALPDASSARTAEGLKLLPAVYEGKGSASFAATLRGIASDACRVAAAAEGGEASADETEQLSSRITELIRQGEANAAAFRRAVNDKASLASLFSLAAAKCVDHGVSSKPHRLALLRAITLLAVFSSLPETDVIELLEVPTTQHLLLTIGKTEIPLVELATDGGESSTQLTPESMLDVDMTCLECQLLLAKKLFVGLPQAAVDASRSVAALRATVASVCKQLLPVVADAQKQVTYAEKFLKTRAAKSAKSGGSGRGKKRERDEIVGAEATTQIGGGDDSDHSGEASIEEMKSALGVLFVVQHVAKYLAVGSDFKVAPSWAR